ncbi:hypothetical protein [Enterobacter sp. Z1]|uniref:hypothetical protein n=1 Tax=Enterobacter sp. Z1 TaxID=2561927 RepID=UPI0011DFC8D7|nr:hypothetical protein [Enterobacter sp. Z1]TYD05501.1 hypothetical protein E4M14_009625 [Enterobacter sp. Z1]
MKSIVIHYKDGNSEQVDNVHEAIDHGDGEISYFIGSGFTRYHALNVDRFVVNDTAISKALGEE